MEITRGFVRTPSFLARFFPLSKERLSEKEVAELFQTSDRSNMTLEKILKDFFKFLSELSEAEKAAYVRALESIQTGSHAQRDAMRSFSEEERVVLGSKALLLPNVRLANGETRQDARQRLMLTFNTPFYTEVLIASMIMAEGVDLHLNCRHIIHHDLCWNPSTLEQRTGRIDRIGAKVERCGEPIRVYLPYISETQDEKMYRVVMDRERWFKVVMGEDYKSEVGVTDKIAERLLFPDEAAQELMLDLRVVRDAV
jgi:superfamily II DNA/RNA helicase